MAIEVRAQEGNPGVNVVLLTEPLDVVAADAVSPTLMEALEQSTAGVIVDLGGVDFISSAGLRVLIAARKRGEEVGKQMALIRAQPAIYKIFKVSKLDTVFRFFEDEGEAIQALWP